jgi:hypothetical protein
MLMLGVREVLLLALLQETQNPMLFLRTIRLILVITSFATTGYEQDRAAGISFCSQAATVVVSE